MTSTVTSKGQITLPAEIRKRLNLQPGDKLDFIVREDGTIEVHPLRGSIQDLKGMLPRPRKSVTIARMQRAIEQGGQG
ncbi:MAG: AbrB family transcriptional regulator [Phycisphaeraceae bacterium]|nr:AbrB family transcriptional regulator [Phycisphaeraceae bacterium]